MLGAGCADVAPFQRDATPAELKQGDVLARRMIDGLGGAEAYGRLRHVSFEWVVVVAGAEVARRRHDWDPAGAVAKVTKGDGDDRVEAWIRLWDRKGVVKVGGKPVTDAAELEEHLDDAHGAWTNDSYWLVSPFKAFDAGVERAEIDGRLRTRFEGVGRTPGDAYLYHFHPDGKLAGWEFLLQSGMRSKLEWTAPVVQAGVTFHTVKEGTLGTIRLDGVTASTERDVATFAPLAELAKTQAAPTSSPP